MRRILKWVGIVLGGILGLLVVAAVVLYLVGNAKLGKNYDVAAQPISVPTDAGSIQRGEHLATILLCTRCHADNLAGQLYFDAPGLLSIPSPNLTAGAGGIGGTYTPRGLGAGDCARRGCGRARSVLHAVP